MDRAEQTLLLPHGRCTYCAHYTAKLRHGPSKVSHSILYMLKTRLLQWEKRLKNLIISHDYYFTATYRVPYFLFSLAEPTNSVVDPD